MFITGDVGVTFLSSYSCETPEIKDCNLKLRTKMNLSTPSYILSGSFLAQEKWNQKAPHSWRIGTLLSACKWRPGSASPRHFSFIFRSSLSKDYLKTMRICLAILSLQQLISCKLPFFLPLVLLFPNIHLLREVRWPSFCLSSDHRD